LAPKAKPTQLAGSSHVPLNSGDLEPTISAANNIGKHFGAVSINLPHTRCSPLAFPATAFGPLDNKTGKMKLTLGGFGGFWGLGGWVVGRGPRWMSGVWHSGVDVT